jgi:hypothetical protein
VRFSPRINIRIEMVGRIASRQQPQILLSHLYSLVILNPYRIALVALGIFRLAYCTSNRAQFITSNDAIRTLIVFQAYNNLSVQFATLRFLSSLSQTLLSPCNKRWRQPCGLRSYFPAGSFPTNATSEADRASCPRQFAEVRGRES